MIALINSFNDILIESFIGMFVVFLALTLLVLTFIFSGKMMMNYQKSKAKKANQIIPDCTEKNTCLNVHEVAAVTYALHLFLSDLHDEESGVLTIKKIERRYSPWSSKIYGLNNIK